MHWIQMKAVFILQIRQIRAHNKNIIRDVLLYYIIQQVCSKSDHINANYAERELII